MDDYFIIIDKLRLGFELVSALVGIFYFRQLKKSHWKWFSMYLLFIFLQEIFWYNRESFYSILGRDYYAYLGIPVQYLFFFWLYSLKSLQNKRLFITCSLVYLVSLPLGIYFEKTDLFYSFNVNIGTVIIVILVVLEFIKQIKNDNILNLKSNRMFYVSLGLILFYFGAYPFHAFQTLLRANYPGIWQVYYLYFLISNCLMYLLFAVSFIWGKEDS